MKYLIKLHPLVSFVYMTAAVGITIFTRNPILLGLSLIGSSLLAALSGAGKSIIWGLTAAAAVTITNPLFSHNGVTALFFIGDTAITAEAFAYGGAFGVMLWAVFLWGKCSVYYLSSDKFIWLFGKIAPNLGLMLSCTLRFIPLFIGRTKEFAAVRGADTIKEYLKAFSSSVNYSMEEAISAAESMRARGYGTAPRTSYALYRFTGETLAALTSALICTLGTILFMALPTASKFFYYPALSEISLAPSNVMAYIFFGILCLLPSAVFIFKEIKCRRRAE